MSDKRWVMMRGELWGIVMRDWVVRLRQQSRCYDCLRLAYTQSALSGQNQIASSVIIFVLQNRQQLLYDCLHPLCSTGTCRLLASSVLTFVLQEPSTRHPPEATLIRPRHHRHPPFRQVVHQGEGQAVLVGVSRGVVEEGVVDSE